MATREQIREGIEAVIQQFEDASPDAGYGYEKEKMADAIARQLHSQGAVIKGRLLTFEGEPVGYEVKPLIEE